VDWQDDGEVTIGFEGVPWHTHGDMLAATSGKPVETAVEDYVRDVVESRSVIAVVKKAGSIIDVWISSDPEKDRTYLQVGETLELRRWNGSLHH